MMPSSPYAAAHSPVWVIQPPTPWPAPGLREIWNYRELLYFLLWREVKVRYKQTALGVAWAVIQPFFTMVVFSVIFGRLAGLPSDGLPYPVFAFSALLPWQLFAFALTESSNSVVANQRVITKVYFPRLIIPLAAVLVGVVDFLVAFSVLLAMLLYYGIAPTAAVLTLPLWTAFAVCAALAVGLWLSAINVKFRDVRYTVPFVTQIWLYATPVAYSTSLIPEPWQFVYAINPMVGVVEGFRWALLGQAAVAPGPLLVSIAVVALMLVGGLFHFQRTERTFADVI
jgi:lipopolysaccharide transport system permease protein